MANEKLVGTWKLVSASSTTSTGERIETPYGPGPAGFLTYGADGRMTSLISYGRKPLSFWRWDSFAAGRTGGGVQHTSCLCRAIHAQR